MSRENKQINVNNNVKVAVKNTFASMQDVVISQENITDDIDILNIPFVNLKKLSLNACKVLRIIIAQCDREDKDFYSYSFTAKELARIINYQAPQSIYSEAVRIGNELFGLVLVGEAPNGEIIKIHPFDMYAQARIPEEEKTAYKKGIFTLTLSESMKKLCLGLNENNKGQFMQYLLCDVTKMNAKNSIHIYELIQRDLYFNTEKDFDTCIVLSLAEIRKVTGTIDKHTELSNFKRKVIHPAIDEISKIKGWQIKPKYLRSGRRVDRVQLHIINNNLQTTLRE